MDYPITTPFGTTPAVPVQPALTGLDVPAAVTGQDGARRVVAAGPEPAEGARKAERRGARHRYWSLRDLSRRIWVGRGYELLCQLVRGGVLPATRSAHGWWIAGEDVQGLVDAFQDRAGKVRAFHGLEHWLRERCWVAPLTAQTAAALAQDHTGFTWRGLAYLPKNAWQVEQADDGSVRYLHRSGAVLPAPVSLAA